MGDATTATNTAMTVSAASASATTGASFIGMINEYAIVLGLALTVLSLLVGVYFNVQTMKWRRQQDGKRIAAAVAEALAEHQSAKRHDQDDQQGGRDFDHTVRRSGDTNRP